MSTNDELPQQVVQPASVARALRHPIRRAALAVTLERGGRVAVADLVAAVAAQGDAYGVDPVPDRRSLRPSLNHRHIPVLAMTDLLVRLGAGAAVEPGTHRLLSHPVVSPTWLRREGANWDALGAVFGQPRRRVAVTILASADLPVGLGPLARAVAAELVGDLSADSTVVSDLERRLHHVGLPMLDDVDVLTYDAGEGRVVDFAEPSLPLPIEGV